MQEILDAIPQRDPFLFVDTIVERDTTTIHTQKTLSGKEDFFQGHFPGNPIMPGVLLCEACFQTGAIIMSGMEGEGLGVVTKIGKTKFKGFVRPGDTLDIFVEVLDSIHPAYNMKGKITVNGKVVVLINFQVALV